MSISEEKKLDLAGARRGASGGAGGHCDVTLCNMLAKVYPYESF